MARRILLVLSLALSGCTQQDTFHSESVIFKEYSCNPSPDLDSVKRLITRLENISGTSFQWRQDSSQPLVLIAVASDQHSQILLQVFGPVIGMSIFLNASKYPNPYDVTSLHERQGEIDEFDLFVSENEHACSFRQHHLDSREIVNVIDAEEFDPMEYF
ncbi:hypothetical protein ACEWMW_13020 [Altererythrobacter sp. MF3-039]